MGEGSEKDRLTAIRNISTRDAMYNMINIKNAAIYYIVVKKANIMSFQKLSERQGKTQVDILQQQRG